MQALILLAWISLVSIARPLPENLCDDRCGPEQKVIWESMKTGRGLNQEHLPGVFSGDCFWYGEYNPRSAHSGGILLERRGSADRFNGSFYFGARENPFAGYDIEEARRDFLGTREDRYEMEHFSNYSFYDANPGGRFLINYWVSGTHDSNDLVYLLAYLGRGNFGLCELSRN